MNRGKKISLDEAIRLTKREIEEKERQGAILAEIMRLDEGSLLYMDTEEEKKTHSRERSAMN